eukprot:scaffold6942_cov72-Phaeocystis_antarctica.AAC.5
MVLAAEDHHVLDAPANEYLTVVEEAEVARAIPAAIATLELETECSAGRLMVVVVTECEAWACEPKFTDGTFWQ